MATKGIHIRIDAKQKKQLEDLFESMGLDVPTAVRMFFRKVEVMRTIPFSIGEDHYADNYTPKQLAYFDKLAREAKQGKNVYGPFNSMEEMWDDLMKRKV